MKKLCLVIAVSMLLTSCCVVTSQECFCNPPEPFLAESAKDWIVPFSEDQKFTTTDPFTREQKIIKEYKEGTECIGGDECCADNPIQTTVFLFDTFAKDQALLYMKVIQNEVIFSADPSRFSSDSYRAVFDVTTGKFTKYGGIDLVETDTIVSGSTYLKVIFQKKDPSKNEILFERLEYVKGIGVTGFTDTSGQVWKKD